MAIAFPCPACQKELNIAADKAGLRVNCPGCGESVTVPMPPEPAGADPSQATTNVRGGATPDAVADSDSNSRPCPMCGKPIRVAARRCRFCGEDLTGGGGEEDPTSLEAGDVLTRSWDIFQNHLGILVGSTLVLMGIGAVAVMAGYAAMVAAMVAIGAAAQGQQRPDAMVIAVFVAIGVGFTFFLFAVNAYLQAGYNLLLLRIVRGERAELADIFSGGRFFWRMFWANVLFTLLTYAGLLLLIVPGVFVMLVFWPFSYVIVDRNTGIVESFEKSRGLTGGNLLAIFILGLAAMGINMLGQMACYVGMIFSVPLTALIFAVAYCRMSGQTIAVGRRA
jgi:uncharacterized membrane protein